MRWIVIVTLLAALSGCNEGSNSHREYIITQAQLEEDFVNSFTDLPD